MVMISYITIYSLIEASSYFGTTFGDQRDRSCIFYKVCRLIGFKIPRPSPLPSYCDHSYNFQRRKRSLANQIKPLRRTKLRDR